MSFTGSRWVAYRSPPANVQYKNNEGDIFILHDGPPYANGNLHMGESASSFLMLTSRSCAQQDPEGYDQPVQRHPRTKSPLRAGMGLPWSADRAQSARGSWSKPFAYG